MFITSPWVAYLHNATFEGDRGLLHLNRTMVRSEPGLPNFSKLQHHYLIADHALDCGVAWQPTLDSQENHAGNGWIFIFIFRFAAK